MITVILFITNLITKFYNAFATHKAIDKQASITKIVLKGIFGIVSQTLTQLVAQIQDVENSHDSDENNTHYGKNNSRKKQTFRRHSTDIPHKTDHNDNDKPTEIYVDTNYKHYNTTIRRTEKRTTVKNNRFTYKETKTTITRTKI